MISGKSHGDVLRPGRRSKCSTRSLELAICLVRWRAKLAGMNFTAAKLKCRDVVSLLRMCVRFSVTLSGFMSTACVHEDLKKAYHQLQGMRGSLPEWKCGTRALSQHRCDGAVAARSASNF